MKTVDWMGSSRSDVKSIAVVLGMFVMVVASYSKVDAAVVTRTITFDDGVDFDVDGDSLESGESAYVIDGMRFRISEGATFLYAQNDSNFYWSGQNDSSSTSLGSEAGSGLEFTLDLVDPALGSTFTMRSITLIGFSTSNAQDQNRSVMFRGSKADPSDDVTYLTPLFDTSRRDALVINFDNLPEDFSNLISLSWNQGPTFRAHQFDNVVFTASAVPEPGSLVMMLMLSLVGVARRFPLLSNSIFRRLLPS
ncbi:PEP-CTERM sorting domain-containing protein [Rhodopirellula sp. JC740]|uniref:PEP-CTERM sorting domain-containing protein n=1 Tax=Rhodopirellula halodulae TaxID=2894198 RepID=A0ABS8NKP3_9BACT|nr:PEP-CTERM sorting domain-containing protein [Rhodopirellula sp. JC740]MCC9644134.1 PEP-CTERM sorting domain-containing protein [Rhodopirellula sp. JC740]